MGKRLLAAATLLISLMFVYGMSSSNPPSPTTYALDSSSQTIGPWSAKFWNLPNPSKKLSSPPVMPERPADAEAQYKNVDLNLGVESPHPDINRNRFVAKFTNSTFLSKGVYTFSAKSDDGIRVYVNGEVVINKWHEHANIENAATVQLPEGPHFIAVEYYENGGTALLALSIEKTGNFDDNDNDQNSKNTTKIA